MRRIIVLFATLFFLPLLLLSQQAQPAQPAVSKPAARTDLYHVHFVKAAPGKTRELLEVLKTPAPDAPMPGHSLLLRHLEGDEWDFVAIEHLGPKFTLQPGPSAPSAARELRAWHNDTYAVGPAWAEFAKAMGLGEPAGAAADKALYVVGTYRGAVGHRAQLEETLNRISATARTPGQAVLLQHAEGSPWDYLNIQRFNSWQDFAGQQDDAEAQGRQRRAGFTQDPGLELREHMASHHDTITNRVPVDPPKAAR